MNRWLLIFFFSLATLSYGQAQESMNYFLPAGVSYNPEVPAPEEFFNQPMGKWHLTHDQVLNYMKAIAAISERAVIQEYARSYENRPLVHVIFTSEENHEQLEQLKKLHYNFSEPGQNSRVENIPLVAALNYGVHGNESSATNSSVLTAYHLAAAEGTEIENLLKNTIILVDPCLNPDGFTRHSTWANMHQSKTDVTAGDSRQFHEVWPGGRTNHYWFDLNRDYLLLVHPESRGRVAKFYEWKPNIFTDHHEMGANSTFFFQPGVPGRNNPLTPEKNYELTAEIARYHAKALDKIGSHYFSEERFDDYYYGKGSSFPDVNGSIGILFEQAGYRGRVRETTNGIRNFAFAIRNQFTVTLSTLQATADLKVELLRFQKSFYKEALEMAENDPVKAYVFGNEKDKVKTQLLLQFLNQHQIEVYENEKVLTAEGSTFLPGYSFVVPTEQKQYRMLKTIFEEVSTFSDSTFYDVSTWTIPYSFDVPFARVEKRTNVTYSGEPAGYQHVKGTVSGSKNEVAWLFRWNEYTAPAALYRLQQAGLVTKVATKEFSITVNGKTENFSYGTILIPSKNQNLEAGEMKLLIDEIAEKTGIGFYGVESGLSEKGIDLGSDQFRRIEKPEILMLIGGTASSGNAGEIWHLFDVRYGIPVTMTEGSNLRNVNLARYNTIILPGGSLRELDAGENLKLKNWIVDGGRLISYNNSWAKNNDISKVDFKEGTRPDTIQQFSYADRGKERSRNSISGAIFNSEIDLSHPLCYGYHREFLPVFKTGTSVAKPLDDKYAQPVKFTAAPYLSGYVSDENLQRIKNAPVVTVEKSGKGRIISYHENMTFRGIWLGTNKLFSNAVFFGNIVD